RGSFYRSDHFPFARAGVPALSIEPGVDFVGRPAGWGKDQAERYNRERYHQPGDEYRSTFRYEGMAQEVRVALRVALAVAEASRPPLVYRTYAEVVPEAERDSERLASLRQAALEYKPAQAIARKQKANGLWGGNLLAPAASKAFGWTEPGTVYQYRRLIELGWPPGERVFRDADRFLFQLLSRIEPDDADKSVAQRALELLV